MSRPAFSGYLLPLVSSSPCKIAYYGHDLHSARFLEEAEHTGHWELRIIANAFKHLESRISKAADFVYYPSAEEVSIVRSTAPQANVHELPPYAYDFESLPKPIPIAGSEFLFVGNFRHLPNVDAAKWLVNEIWPKISSRFPAARLTIVGSNPPRLLLCLNPELVNVHFAGWVSEHDLTSLYRQSRIVLIPLRFGAGVKHKIVSAVVQGVPVVTTLTGLQGLPELAGCVGVASSSDEFVNECGELLLDDRLWSKRVLESRCALAQRFNRRSMWSALTNLRYPY